MKTLKVMSIIGIIISVGHLLLANTPYGISVNGAESTSDFLGHLYLLALSIVGLVQANKALKMAKGN
jgi:hypothetical protein